LELDMASLVIRNLTALPLSVPPPVNTLLAQGGSTTVVLSLEAAQLPEMVAMVQAGLISITAQDNPDVSSALEPVLQSSVLTCTLTPAAEGANAIVVTGQVTDLSGTAVEAATRVTLTTIAGTALKGVMTVASGTQIVNQASSAVTGSKVSQVVLTSTAAGVFSVSVADDIAESVSMIASVDGGLTEIITLTFA
jgi:hypothetical protein